MLYLEPVVTEIQFNFVADKHNINTRKALCRVRLNAEVAWIDFLQGRGFLDFLMDSADEFADTLKVYGIKYIEANISKQMVSLLKRALGTKYPLSIVTNTSINGNKMCHVRIDLYAG